MSERLSVAFRTLGCKVNRVESEQIAASLLGHGVELVDEGAARVVVVNTCTVTGEADAKTRKAVRHALRQPGSPVVVVTGCLASLDADGLRALGERVVVEADKSKVAEQVSRALGIAPAAAEPAAPARVGEGFRTRVPLKVQDGCDSFCSYCIVPYARGVPRSEPAAALVEQVRALVAGGVPEIVLTGINLGRYRDGETDLAELVAALAATGVPRLRLSSIEPMDLDARLLETLATLPATCRHLHVPLQSGSDAVLRAMNRGYTSAAYLERIAAAREALPGLAVTADVIVGFPGETDADAQATLAVCEAASLAGLHVFRYSARQGTGAAALEPVAPERTAERAARARDLGARLKDEFARSEIGRRAEVLVERVDADGVAEGVTREYLRLRVAPVAMTPPRRASVGELVEVVVGAPGVERASVVESLRTNGAEAPARVSRHE